MTEKDRIIEETENLLRRLLDEGSFYLSAIELNNHILDNLNGEEWEIYLKDLLNEIKNLKEK